MNYHYRKMDPDNIERTSLQDSHAVFGSLWGDGLIERFDVYRRVDDYDVRVGLNEGNVPLMNDGLPKITQQTPKEQSNSMNPQQHTELAVVDVKLGSKLNGHAKIVHGGIISLLLDESMGWAYECLELQQKREQRQEEQHPQGQRQLQPHQQPTKKK